MTKIGKVKILANDFNLTHDGLMKIYVTVAWTNFVLLEISVDDGVLSGCRCFAWKLRLTS